MFSMATIAVGIGAPFIDIGVHRISELHRDIRMTLNALALELTRQLAFTADDVRPMASCTARTFGFRRQGMLTMQTDIIAGV
jgi:hypothetical protein